MENAKGLPQHIAIIMDGNGRWAKERGLSRIQGHQKGVETIQEIVRAAQEFGIAYLTLYAFSKENWARPKEEVGFLMKLLSRYLDLELPKLKKNGIHFNAIGEIHELSEEVQKKIERNKKETAHNRNLFLTLALSYSSRSEIVAAARKLCTKTISGALKPEQINEALFSSELYTADIPDPDLLIRTSGEPLG